ncbi:DNA translocase FtsK [Sporosarcina aquimarina]|uniref:DNA translocase FtsK n=1 Tax=Sporosarcina aquimarina TaxID=114975 RepID=A0ABU4G036_9BACL|nr:DNA translocase FtsK [Sporosarcina aquimarina]MDW0110325.1 DNA translocase FtsK [Sporosarcina aquimarina]
MSWIKKTMGRLFGSEPEEDYEENTNVVLEKEQPHETDTPQRPAFRFPMITDAEIYGWDEDPNETLPMKNDTTYKKETDEQVKSVPFYKNSRWPEEPPKGEIHRAGDRKKYQETPALARETAATKVKTTERKTEIVNQRNNVPFKPTEVPSPVYGFSQPKSKSTAPHVTAEQERSTSVEMESVTKKMQPTNRFLPKEVLPSGRKIETSNADLLKTSALPKPASVQEKEEQLEDLADDAFLKAEKFQTEKENNQDILIDSSQDAGYDVSPSYEAPIESFKEERTEQEKKSVTSHIAVLDREETDENEDLEVLVEAEDINTTEPENATPLNEDFSPPASEEGTPSPENQVEKKERMVPFNVVMLKSDKEKHSLREMAETSVTTSAPSMPVKKEQTLSGSITVPPRYQGSVQQQPEVKQELVPSVTLTNEAADPIDEEPLMHYVYPSVEDLLPAEAQQEDTEWLTSQSEKLVEALSHFSVQADILEAVQGPTVTRFELTVGIGTKVSKVRNLTDDLKLALAAEDIRIQAPIPGTSSIGIEIPNRTTRPVRISEVIDTDKFKKSDSPLEAVLGLSLTGEPVTIDLRKMPHGMIAGATGSGKSVCINSILVSLLYKASPTELKMMLIDPKMVELAPFNGIPHLISPVITDVKAATAALKWAVDEMERRYELFAHAGARNIERYNQMAEANRQFSQKMPYLLIVIDELADLMMVAPNDVEVSISRIAQKARACGIHLIIATQRPSVDVITGIIKANIPTRIAFAVSSQIDSRTIIDSAGADRLLGRGDMLYVGNGQSAAVRLQGTFVTDDEIECIIDHVKSEASPEYLFGQEDLLAAVVEEEESDPLFNQACSFIIEQGSASTSLMQRHFSIGYNRAAKIMDRMEAHGFISEQRGSRSRDVYLTDSGLQAFLNPDHDA